jgi:predicted phage terminase large subunit-like protein
MMTEALEAVSSGEIHRLIINVPPRHMKSLTVSVFWPAWDWIKNYWRRWLFSSYAQVLSTRDSLKCRRVIESPLYRELLTELNIEKPGEPLWKLTTDQNTKTRFDNTEGGYRLATAVGGSLTGEGGDIAVVDDPHNVIEAESEAVRESTLMWWDESMSTRLNDPKAGAYVIIMQRVHQRDLVGHIKDKIEKKTEEPWEELVMPARYEGNRIVSTRLSIQDWRTEIDEPLWPERYPEAELKRLGDSMGRYAAAGQLQQRPAPREGGLIQSRWFNLISPEQLPVLDGKARFWDMAATVKAASNDPDWTAGPKCGFKGGRFYIVHIKRLRETPGQIENEIKKWARLDAANDEREVELYGDDAPWTRVYMEQEPGASGKAVIDHYRRNVIPGFSFRGFPSTGSKESYVDALAAAAEAGNVYAVIGNWNESFFEEVDVFPNGAHDDMIDAVAKLYHILVRGVPSVRALTGNDNDNEPVTVSKRETDSETDNDEHNAWLRGEDLD